MPNRLFSLHRLFLLGLALAVFFACHLTKNEEVEDSFSFPALKDSIAGADQALIVLKAESGQVIDTLFNGPVTASTTFKGLKAPHFTGGKVTIEIQATQNGTVIYQITRSYDGDKDETLGTVVLVSPSASVKIQWPSPKLREGDSVPLPATNILPTTLSNPTLGWSSLQPSILLTGDTYLKALLPGSATLVVWLKSDPLKRDSVVVEVFSKNDPIKAVDSLKLTPDPLTLALRGPAGRFTVNPSPASASKEVTWTALDGGIVTVSADGLLHPVALGTGRILAVSKLEPTALDTALVEVIAAAKVDSVRFEKDSVEVFVQGSPDSLRVLTYPALANPSVTFSVQDASVAQVDGGKVKGLKEGETWVLARSVEDPTRVDSLRLIVFPLEKVDSVRLAQDSLKLYVKGESQSLTASIFPSTLQKRFLWRSADPALATVDVAGRVTPVSEGKVYVSVTARADGQRRDSALVLVKKDTPQLRVGRDTVVAVGTSLTHTPVVTQEYGLVVMFKWDLNGDGTYEDSSATVRPNLAYLYNEAKEYGVRFYVRDTEGNDTVVIRKVKAVNGRVVQILSPKDGSFTNQSPITVTWMVDGVQEANSQALNLGANTLVRSAQDSAKNTYSASITVTLDQTAPSRPTVQGSSVPVNTLTPAWSWTSGGGGGNGTYRYRLDNPDLNAAPVTADTFYTASTNQNAGTHTLYVQERDEAGNWSPSGSFAVRIDTTAPPAPTLTVAPSSPTFNPKPTWSWTGGVGDAYRYYRYKLGDDDFRSGGKDTTGTSFTPPTGFTDGTYTLYVQERDSAGNWSASASKPITIDLEAPTAPALSAVATLTNDETPTWTWTAGTGGNGNFRYKINNADLTTGATATTLLAYTPAVGLGEGTFTLYVQERDAAGNWSSSGSRQVRIDLTPPTAPRIDSTPYSPLNSLRPKWTWRSGTGGARVFRARVDTSNLLGAPEKPDSTFTPGLDLSESMHTLYVQERDSAGNWSEVVSRPILLSLSAPIGKIGFTEGGAEVISLVISPSGDPYIAYRDPDLYWAVTAQRFSDSGWKYLGKRGFSEDPGASPSMVLGPDGSPYIAYAKGRIGTVIVMKFNGVSWDSVGEGGISAGAARSTTMKIDRSGVLYLGFSDIVNNGASVVRYNGRQWLNIGKPGFTEEPIIGLQFALDPASVPYVAFVSGGYVSVMKYGGNAWEVVGKKAFALSDGGDPRLTISETGVPYVASQDLTGKVVVSRFLNNTWDALGSAAILGEPRSFDLALDAGGRPYLAYSDKANGGKVALKKYMGDRWEQVGTVDIGMGDAGGLALFIREDGVPVIGFTDGLNGGKASVYKTAFDQ